MHPAAVAVGLALAGTAPAHSAPPYVPAAPTINYAVGRAPGLPSEFLSSAQYDPNTKTVYHEGQMGRFARGHEAGHALDFQVLTDGDRDYFTRAIGMRGPWAPPGTVGKPTPREVFADWYANAVIRGDPARSWASGYSSAPDPKAFRAFERALARFGRRHQLAQYR